MERAAIAYSDRMSGFGFPLQSAAVRGRAAAASFSTTLRLSLDAFSLADLAAAFAEIAVRKAHPGFPAIAAVPIRPDHPTKGAGVNLRSRGVSSTSAVPEA